MHRPNPFSSATLHHVPSLISRSPLRRGFPVVLLVLGLFALSPMARAVDPPPDGGYPGDNTAEGDNALFSLTTGQANTAIGFQALFQNTTGFANTANGSDALSSNTTSDFNTGSGHGALANNTTGINNTASGFNALKSNTTAFNNTANGQGSLQKNTTGGFNTADGFQVLLNNTTGSFFNIALGANAGASLNTGSDNINIGNPGAAGEGNKIRIGTVRKQTATFIAGVHGVTIASGVGVVVSSNGQLGTVTSSARFKEGIHPMDEASEAILALKPVTFRYKPEIDPENVLQFGLVAEQVEKINPDLVVRDPDGKPYMVRYDAVNAMLLNEFLKEHRKVEEQQAAIVQLKALAARQQKQIEDLTATVQKVSDQFASTKPAPQLVANR